MKLLLPSFKRMKHKKLLRPTKLRILITNNTLAGRAGSELYVRDIAIALVKRGHYPVAYSPILGEVAEELNKATVPVIQNLNALNFTPDIIHGQHHMDAMVAMMRFPTVPALYFCHGWIPMEEMPPLFPSIVRYLAVDDLCQERLLTTQGVAAEKIRTLYNFVDLERFKQRAPLPEKPRTALIFNNYAVENSLVAAIRSACNKYGIDRVDLVGEASGNSVTNPELILSNYDVVFAKARCALEAMAVGCAVVVTGMYGLAGMITSENVNVFRPLNFGIRAEQTLAVTSDNIYAQLQKYNPDDARQVSNLVRDKANMSSAIDELEKHYYEAVQEKISLESTQVLTAAANYMDFLVSAIKLRASLEKKAHLANQLMQSVEQLTQENQQLQEQLQMSKNERLV